MAIEKLDNEKSIKNNKTVTPERNSALLENAAVAAMQALLMRTGGDPDRVAQSAANYAKALVEALKQ